MRQFDDLPGPRGLPLLGNAHQVQFDRLHLQLEQWSEAYGPRYKLRFGPRRVIVVSDPTLVDTPLRQRPHGYRRPSLAARISREMGRPTGLFFAEGDVWTRQRQMVAASFTAEAIRRYFPRLQAVTSRLTRKWLALAQKEQEVDLSADLKRYAVDVIAGLAFGVDVNSVESGTDEIQSHVDFIFAMSFRRSMSIIPYWRYVPTPGARRLARSVSTVNQAIESFISQAAERRRLAPPGGDPPTDLLATMLCAADAPGGGITTDDIAGNVAAMLFAGEDSPASTLAWTIALLSEHPHELAACQAEARSACPAAESLSLDQLDGLHYLDACLREAMRLKPVAPFMALESLRDNELGDVHVAGGTLVLCLLRQAGLATVGVDRRFVPGRWLKRDDPNERSLRTTVRSFGAGPRMCPGRYLALLEMKSVLAALLRNFEIGRVVALDGPIRESMSVTMNPGPLKMWLSVPPDLRLRG